MMDLITLKDAMARLKVSEPTIRRLAEDGTFTKYKVGAGVRLDWNEVVEKISPKVLTSVDKP